MDEIDGNLSKGPIKAGENHQFRNAVPVPGKMATRVGQPTLSTRTAQPSTTTQNMEEIKNIAKTLGRDVVHYYTSKKGVNGVPTVKYARTLRRTVDELSERHDILFKGMVNKLGLTRENFTATFTNIAEELFKDGKYNWGRVVSVYAFTGRLARYCEENNMHECAEKVGQLAGDFVAQKLGPWIGEQGGWDAFDEYFPDQHGFEEKVWKGLLFTAVGLGALATMVAVR